MNEHGVGSWIERRARIAPDRTAIVWGETRRSYEELAERIRRSASAFRALGVRRGDRVGWIGSNHPAFLEALFASAQLGAALSPVNARLAPATLTAVLADAAPTLVLTTSDAPRLPLPPDVRARIVVGAAADGDLDYETLLRDAKDEPVETAVRFDDLCMLPFTSGTVGQPKGVMLTHGNVTWNAINMLSIADFVSEDVTIAIAPLFRVGGTGVNVLPVLFKGGTVVVPERAEPDEILRLIEDHGVTIGFGNPDLLDALARSARWPSTDLSSIRTFITGGAPVPERLTRTYLERDVPFLQGYGLSEAAPAVLLLDHRSALRKVGSAGKPPLFVDVRIVRRDGSECAPDETGELLVRGPNVMAGYWNRPDETRRTIDEQGWLRTGDAARADDEGYIWIVDRTADAFESNGTFVYPGDVERALMRHPAVADAGVTGQHGVVTASVVLARATTVDELLNVCRAHLPSHAVPARISFAAALPRSPVGKLLRHELQRLHDTLPS